MSFKKTVDCFFLLSVKMVFTVSHLLSKHIYYINTNEIPGELSRGNMISSTCEKITVAMATEMVLYFIGVYIICAHS